jgi:hypothetical protein
MSVLDAWIFRKARDFSLRYHVCKYLRIPSASPFDVEQPTKKPVVIHYTNTCTSKRQWRKQLYHK